MPGQADTIRVLAYNVRHCQGVGGAISHERTAAVISGIAPDVCGLFELWSIPHSLEQPKALSRLTRMNGYFHPAHRSRSGWFGNLVLTSGAIGSAVEIDLKGRREGRGCVIVDIEFGDIRFALAATHLGLDRATRALQTAAIAEALPRDRPLILVGDLNSGHPERGVLGQVLTFPDRAPKTFPSLRPILALDHIGFSRHWRLERVWTERSLASDHVPLVAELRLLG